MRVEDNLGPDQELLTEFQGESYPKLIRTDELVVTSGNVEQPGNWKHAPADQYSVDGGTVSWTAEAGYYYAVQYVSRITDGGAATTYTNSATVTLNDNVSTVESEVVRHGGDGTGSGDQVGRFSITKDVRWDGPAVEGLTFGGTFTVTTPSNEKLSGEFTVREGETWTSGEFATGSIVHIDEILPTDPAGIDWAQPVLSQNDFAVVGATTTSVTLTNTATVAHGSFRAHKLLEGDAASRVPDDAVFLLDYTYPAGPGFPSGEGTLELPADGTVVESAELPVGAVLALSERAPVAIEGASWTGATLSTDVVTIERDEVVTVSVTNTLTSVKGGLIINKLIRGAGAGAFSRHDELAFDVVCVLDGVSVFEQEVVLQVDGRRAVTSDELGPIPARSECTVSETGAGNADESALPQPAKVVIPLSPETGKSEVVSVSMTNFYSAGSVEVSKTLAGDAAAVAAAKDKIFEIVVTCQIEEANEAGNPIRTDVYSGEVLIRGGQTKYLVDESGKPRLLPVGTRCFGEETDSGGATAVELDHDSFENGAIVTSGGAEHADDVQVITINAVNTFTDSEDVPKKVAPRENSGSLPVTGGPSAGGIGLLASGTALLGIAVVLLTRRRKETGQSA